MSPTVDAPMAQPSDGGAEDKPVGAPTTADRSETFRMKLKRHESMVDSLKSRTAVKKILSARTTTHSRSNSDIGLELK